MDELLIDGQVYIPSRKAAEITGYAKDYIGQLCREGRVTAKLIGRNWYILESSIRAHRFGSDEPLNTAGESPVLEKEETPIEAWSQPSYVSEEVAEIPLHTTSLENTTPYQESPVEEPINTPVTSIVEDEIEIREPEPIVEEEPEPIVEEEELTLEEPIVEEPFTPVTRSYGAQMDIAPVREAPPYRPATSPVPPMSSRQSHRERPRRRSKSLVARASFVAFILIVGAITVIGTGSLASFIGTMGGDSGIIDFLSGIVRVEKGS